MTNETFEEKFPELIGFDIWQEDKIVFRKEIINNFCLSKQKVRDAIKKVDSSQIGFYRDINEVYVYKKKLLKELGLEEE